MKKIILAMSVKVNLLDLKSHKKYSFTLLIVAILSSCNGQEKPLDTHFSPIKLEVQENYSLDNPAIYMGSSFGQYFQILHKTGKYEEMLKVTSQSTIEKFSREELLRFYQEMDFSFPLKLKAFENEILYYKTEINATQKTIQINVVIENEECKISLDELNKTKPFLGM